LIILFTIQLFGDKIVIKGDTVVLDYTGYLDDQTIFDTSVETIGVEAGLQKQSYTPLGFKIGDNQVIPGFEEQVIGMNLGEKKTFTLTPEKAYGEVQESLILKDLKREVWELR